MQSPSRLSLFVDTDAGGYSEMLKQKEREYRHLWEQRYNDLQELIRKKDASYAQLQSNFARLQEDFNYNLQLIKERDGELEKYDVAFSTMTHSLNERDEKLTDLKNQLLTLQEKLSGEQSLRFSMSEQNRVQLEALQDQMAQMRAEQEETDRRHQEQFEAFRADARFQIKEKEQNMEEMRRDLVVKYEGVKRDLEGALDRTKSDVQTLDERLQSEVARAAKLGEVRAALEAQVLALTTRADTAEEHVDRLQRELAMSRAHAEELEHLSDAVTRDASQWKDRALAIERSSTELRVKLEAELEQALREKADGQSRLQAEHTDRVSRLTAEHSRQVAELQEEHSRTMKSIMDEHRMQLTMTRNEHETKLNTLLEAKAKEAEETDKRHAALVLTLKQNHDKEVETLRLATSRDHESLRSEVARVASERDQFLQRLEELDSRVVPHLKAVVETAEAEARSLQQQVDMAKKEAMARKEEVNQLQAERTTIINRSDEAVLNLQSELSKAKAQILALQSHADTRALTQFHTNATPTRPLFPGDMGAPSPLTGGLSQFDASRIIELESANDRLRTVVTEMRQDAENMHARFAQVSSELAIAQQKLANGVVTPEAAQRFQQTELELNSLSNQTNNLAAELNNARKQLEDANEATGQAKNEVVALRQRISALEIEVARLQNDRARLMELNNELRAAAANAQTTVNIQALGGVSTTASPSRAQSLITIQQQQPAAVPTLGGSTHGLSAASSATGSILRPAASIAQSGVTSTHISINHQPAAGNAASQAGRASQVHSALDTINNALNNNTTPAAQHVSSAATSIRYPAPSAGSAAGQAAPQAASNAGSAVDSAHRRVTSIGGGVASHSASMVSQNAAPLVAAASAHTASQRPSTASSLLPGATAASMNLPAANSERATSSQLHASDKLKSVHARRQELLDRRRASSSSVAINGSALGSQAGSAAPAVPGATAASVVGSWINQARAEAQAANSSYGQ